MDWPDSRCCAGAQLGSACFPPCHNVIPGPSLTCPPQFCNNSVEMSSLSPVLWGQLSLVLGASWLVLIRTRPTAAVQCQGRLHTSRQHGRKIWSTRYSHSCKGTSQHCCGLESHPTTTSSQTNSILQQNMFCETECSCFVPRVVQVVCTQYCSSGYRTQSAYPD